MKILSFVGGLCFVLGLICVIWGVVEMYDGRDTMDLKRDASIIVDDGDFPRIGVAGAILGGIGLVIISVGALAGRRST